jgi:hypothetical protein
MASVVCTLFENHYHYGLAALANSLYKHGYKGPIYAGYKGVLPSWCAARKENQTLGWPDASTFEVAEGIVIHLLPIKIDSHLSFYKPDFMVRLIETLAKDKDGIAYFDPDIVIKYHWSFFESWMSYGVALVHENITRPVTHPTRHEWQEAIDKTGREKIRNVNTYINSGFCGVSKENIGLIKVWSEVIDTGRKFFNLNTAKFVRIKDNSHAFFNLDQDALNIALMCTNTPISEIGPEGMDFLPGGFTMSHALGHPKPWRKKFIRSAIKGRGPSLPEKAYWENMNGPIQLETKNFLRAKRLKISIASFIARFYRRS